VAQAATRFPGTRLLLLTRQTAEATALLRTEGFSPETVTMASVEASEIPRWLAQAHAGLAFYTPGFSTRGTCPTKVGEYLAMGLPVVVNAGVGDMDALLRRARVGVVISEHSPNAYDDALGELEQLWADAGLADRCRAAAQGSCSLQTGIARYWQVYERLGPSGGEGLDQSNGKVPTQMRRFPQDTGRPACV
jgi:glycosyltransferase involved in cell wall biosynthesis